MITAAIIGRSSSSHYFPISRALTTLHLPTAAAQPILPCCYPQNSSSFSYHHHLSFRRYYIIDTMTRSSVLAVTTTCTQLFLLIGGIQSFATPFNHHRNNDLTNNNNHQKGAAKKDFKLWSQATDSSGEAILDLSEGRSSGSVLTDLVTNGAPKDEEEACSDDATTTTTNGKTTDNDVAKVITKQPISTPPTTTSGTKIIATDDQFIKSLPDKRNYRAITLPNQLTVLLTSDPMTDVESASVHVRAGHFDDPPNRAGLAHFHEHVRLH